VANEFWLSDRQWAVLEPLLPMHRRGVKPKRNREVISGIVHVLKVGCRWRDCQRYTARTRRSTIGSIDGRETASGKRCWKRWWI
jgi:transposase